MPRHSAARLRRRMRAWPGTVRRRWRDAWPAWPWSTPRRPPHSDSRRCRGFADLVGKVAPGRRQHLDPQGRGRRRRSRCPDAAVPARLAVRGVLQGVLRPRPHAAAAAAAQLLAGLGLRRRSRRLRRHQQPRDRRRRRDHRDLQRRHRIQGQADRHATPRPIWPCSRSSATEPFPFVEWADSDEVRVGDWMLAIGNPFGLGSTVTAGIVSARGRDINAGPYDDFMQIDAAINRGNSGGPSFTLDGKVFGINTAIFSPSGGSVGIGFAIPANLAQPVIDSLMSTGQVARGWLGVRIQSVTEDIAESLGLREADGALVASVTPGGPAAKARHPARRRHPRVRRQEDRPDAHAAADRRRDADRQGARGQALAQGRGDDGATSSWASCRRTSSWRSSGRRRTPPTDDRRRQDRRRSASPSPASMPSCAQQFSLAEAAKGVVITEVGSRAAAAEENLRRATCSSRSARRRSSSPAEVSAKLSQAQAGGQEIGPAAGRPPGRPALRGAALQGVSGSAGERTRRAR